MADEVSRELARDPEYLEWLLVSRQRAGDADGMAALYEPDAVLDYGGRRLMRGREAIRAFYAELVATGRHAPNAMADLAKSAWFTDACL